MPTSSKIGISAQKAVFVSSNTKDYAETNGAVVRKDLENEFKSLGLEYAPNMAAAKYLLDL